MFIKNGEVFTLKNGGCFEALTIKTTDGYIRDLTTEPLLASDPSETVIDATGYYVIPGLVDIHFHGCDGFDFCDGTFEALDAICRYELQNGITDICPATMTLDTDSLYRILENATNYCRQSQSASAHTDPLASASTADIIGIHMEGPFISPAKKGAQNADHVIPMTKELLDAFLEKSQGLLRLMTIAPETENALELIELYRDKLHFSIGHSEADYETALKAMEAGALHITHLYNAMPPMSHRAPGIIGAASDTTDCMVELICDGIHIAPSVVRATFKLFGADNIILISDSTAATGKPDGIYTLGDKPIVVKNRTAYTAENGLPTSTIAGSATNLYDCMICAVKMGIPLSAAVKAATINPCKSIGLDKELGSIEIGKKAHLLLIDKKDLSLKQVIK